jgi:hypothetical protein
MKSETITVQQLFQDPRQYCVPFYQRAFVWTLEDQWEQLWEDIRSKAEARVEKTPSTPHFLGAVVLEPQQREGLLGVDLLHIIDGQQRLTTLQFVIKSLTFALVLTGLEPLAKTFSTCVMNRDLEAMQDRATEIYKVWPTFKDRTNFRLAMDAGSLSELKLRFPASFRAGGELRKIGVDHPPAFSAVWHFTNWFQAWINEDEEHRERRADALVRSVLRDLKLVSIVLEKDDDAQTIFETLNGRGAQLFAIDLVRNFLFMRADRDGADSEELYDSLWSQFETDYWSALQRRGRINKPRMEWFLHATLQIELEEDIDLGRLYFEYRRYAGRDDDGIPAAQQLATLNAYAIHYKELVNGKGGTPLANFGHRIAAYNITTLHPLAMFIAAADVSDQAKREMFNDLSSYLVRRAICGLTNKNYNNVFLTTLRQLKQAGVGPAALRNILSAPTGGASRWPTDTEFRSACLKSSLYDAMLDPPLMRAILTELEGELRNGARPEERSLPDLSDLDIDHILPKSWFAHWPLADETTVTATEASEARRALVLGEVLTPKQVKIDDRQSLVQTLGNLTLLNLSVNREAQHLAFPVKRDLLIANTSLRLNVPLVALKTWDEEQIRARGALLADAALRVWPGPGA